MIQEEEGIEFERIEYNYNDEVLTVIESNLGGIISLLDDELKMPGSNDMRLIDNVDKKNRKF